MWLPGTRGPSLIMMMRSLLVVKQWAISIIIIRGDNVRYKVYLC